MESSKLKKVMVAIFAIIKHDTIQEKTNNTNLPGKCKIIDTADQPISRLLRH